MKKQVFAFAIMMAAFGSANAQISATASAEAKATVVAPITLEKATNLQFGKIAVKADQDGTIVVAASEENTATVNGGVQQMPNATVSAAKFDVTGEAATTYTITIPASVELVHATDATKKMTATLSSNNLTTNTLDGSGKGVVLVGGSLAVSGGQKAGAYTSAAFDVTVAYN